MKPDVFRYSIIPMQSSFSKFLGLLVCPLLVVLSSTAYAQSDVTQPGDPVIASSSNSPGSEGVANAIDNTEAKYLNRDSANDAKPSGFAVTPSVGITRVIGMTIQSANDAADRDPKTVTLEGSNDSSLDGFNGATNTWELIVGLTNIPPWTARLQTKTFFFDNFKAYKHYRWTVIQTQGIAGVPSTCCMQVAEVELLGGTLPPDVTQPGDPVIASSSNSPGSEGVANAIDNTEAKYLNRDSANDAKPSGFVVSPSIGRSLVTGMTIQSANDAADRDPKTVTLEGSNDASLDGFNGATNTWELIVGLTNIPPWTARLQTRTFLFDNFKPYRHYRWTVIQTQGTGGVPSTCCMQVAEVEILGTSAPKDVTQPGDPIIASSSNSPGSEGVANAIDNTEAKYLNRDSANDAKPSGFAVSPSIGASTVIGMTIQSANDAADRDPKTVTLEGSNDRSLDGFNGATNTWELIVGLTNIPPWTARLQVKEFYFANKKSFKHYRWTVLQTQGTAGVPSTCCMQIAEVELLAVTQSNPCGQTAFVLQPVDTPALLGSPATFLAKVNGPWTVQWLRNGQPIPGATTLSYSTPPVDASVVTNDYSLAIVGCQTSQVVRASIFTPSATKSIGINFAGGNVNDTPNGTPTYMATNDIAGIQLQAYWINATNHSPGSGTGQTGDGLTLPDALNDSDNAASTITVDFASSGGWGAGVGTETPLERMLNGLIRTPDAPGTPGRITFGNVPAGNHAVLVYLVGIPLQFQNGNYWITGTASVTNYVTVMNADQYKPAPGFYRGSSTNPNARTLATFVRFDNVQPLGGAGGTIELGWDTAAVGGYDRGVPVNGIQLVLNAPNPGLPPAITVDPQPTVSATNGTVTLTVTATGNNLTYQWRKNGANLPNGGHISGATTSTLTISSFSDADAGIYSVAVFGPAGSVVSENASVRTSKFDIKDALVAYLKLNETSGTNAVNSATNGRPGAVNGTATWVAGKIANALSLDGSTYVFVDNYTKATKGIAASAWVNLDPSTAGDAEIVRNAQGALSITLGQFELRLALDSNDGTLKPQAAIATGPNLARVTGPTAFPTASWHHIAFTADGAQLRLYVDGQQVAVSDYLGDINPPGIPYLSIGARLNLANPADPTSLGPDLAAPNFLTGSLDDVAVWTRVLTADEVSRIYAAGQAGNALDTVVETLPATPIPITVVRGATGIALSWGSGFKLQSTDSLSPANWLDVPGAVSGFNAPTTTGTKFYRLISTP